MKTYLIVTPRRGPSRKGIHWVLDHVWHDLMMGDDVEIKISESLAASPSTRIWDDGAFGNNNLIDAYRFWQDEFSELPAESLSAAAKIWKDGLEPIGTETGTQYRIAREGFAAKHGIQEGDKDYVLIWDALYLVAEWQKEWVVLDSCADDMHSRTAELLRQHYRDMGLNYGQ